MLSLGPLAFTAPWLLTGALVLPVLWWLLRVLPPAPQRIAFPAIRLLRNLETREETPARTPWWLILLRLALAGVLILALAHPLLNPGAQFGGSGPLVIVIDNGWTAARHWDERKTTIDHLVDQAERENHQIVLLPTARLPQDVPPPGLTVMRAADARAAADDLTPRPWPVDRPAAAARLDQMQIPGRAVVVWLCDGIEDGSAAIFARRLAEVGTLRLMSDSGAELPRLLAPADPDDKDLTATLRRADLQLPEEVWVRALAEDGRLLARTSVIVPQGDATAVARLPMPSELRNQATALQIEGEASAGAVLLLDERWRRRPVGIVTARAASTGQPLLSGAYYLDKALSPFSEVRSADVETLLKGNVAVLAMPDVAPAGAPERNAIVAWMEDGGTVLRFAGPHLAEQAEDDFLPVTLRHGGRTLGGTLSWATPAHLAPFAPSSPFAGLGIPNDVTVSRQVLAEPTVDLSGKTWAQLSDGTPLVTAERHGSGWLVLVHTTADPEWSNLALSGLFVDMLRRIVAQSQGIGGNSDSALPPVEVLDGFGRLQRASAAVQTIAAGAFGDTKVSPRFPPGFYGTRDSRRALNLAPAVSQFDPIGDLSPGVTRETYAESGHEIDVRPPLLAIAIALGLIDLVVGYALRGLLPRLGRSRGATGTTVLLLALIANAPAKAANDDFAIKATSEFHLAYVRTGNRSIDDDSRAGLAGLSAILNQRTAVETAAPFEVDVEQDELIFFPLLYWPVVDDQPSPSPQAVERINRYLATGGTILFDTRDQGARTALSAAASQDRLRRLATGLVIPPLVPVAPDHVLTRSFYLLQDFPGRWAGGAVWIEPVDNQVNDGVASVIVGGNDWSAAWATDDKNRPLYPVMPGGEQQREMAYRFGVNLVMYVLTGNYKSDQVHVPAILERLGQ